MAAEQQPKPQLDSDASVQIHVTPKGLQAQEGTGELKVATTDADIPWLARLHIEAYGAQAAEAPKGTGTEIGEEPSTQG